MYEKNKVMENALEYFKGDTLAANVWVDKYALKDKENFVEKNPDETIVRIASELARIEKNYKNTIDYDTIYDLLKGFNKFVFGGSILFGVGNNNVLSTLGNCFVLPSPIDSYGGIFKSDQELAQIYKRRGGVGIDISSLRPKKAYVNNAANSSTGAVSFMERYSNTTREVAQEGRRGALMLTMNVDHPDIQEFVLSKDNLSKITGANISVKISDYFMECIEEHKPFALKFDDDVRWIWAETLWKTIIHQAWKNGEPGLLFWDNIINESPADCYTGFETISTNPCSELPLCEYDSCRISAINLYAYVAHPFTKDAYFDYDQLRKDTIIYQRLMDDIIDLEAEKIIAIRDKIAKDPEPDDIKKVEYDMWYHIQNKLLMGRRTGLGQMGLADAGAALGLTYGDKNFNFFAKFVNETIAKASYESSIIMAEERGAFPAWSYEKERNNPYLKRVIKGARLLESYKSNGRRNIANLTIAPTGSISILAQVSSGVEPVFALSYIRKRKVTEDNPNKSFKDDVGNWWEEYTVYHPIYQKYLDIAKDTLPNPYANATAHEIDPMIKLKLQSLVQPWIDHSISVTYNLPNEATEESVSELYFNAWRMGLKGLTVYREGSRDGVLKTHKNEFKQHDAPRRPKVLPHDVYSIMSKGQHWIVCVGMLDGKPYEVFAFNNVSVNGTKFAGEVIKQARGRYDLVLKDVGRFENITESCSDEENLLTRMISTSLRHGADIKFVVEQLNKSTGDITSFGKGIARVLKKYTKEELKGDIKCPECEHELTNEGGCITCKNCGWSKCS